MTSFTWRRAFRIAWREARASSGKFLFVVLAVAIGVGALSGVRGFSQAFRDMLLRDARQLMAGDLAIRLFHEPRPEQMAAIEALERRGVERTWITETVSMMSSPGAPRPLLVSVKAVDPGKYPFYGQIELDPPGALANVLDENSLVASDDLLVRLGVKVGEQVKLGDAGFRVAARVTLEPDRMTGSLNIGPRVMLSRDAMERAGLLRLGSRAAQRYLFRLPAPGISIAEAREILESGFEEGRVADFREVHPTIRRGLDRATSFLSLVSLVALIVGALGVGMAMHSHLQNKLDSIAIMKCLGARSGQIMQIYLVQTLALGLAGSLLGISVGYAVQAWAPRLIENYFPVRPDLAWQPVVALQGLAVGLLTTLLFTLPPLLSIRRVRPALIFRRDMEGPRKTLWQRFEAWKSSLAAGLVIVAGIGAIAAWLADSVPLGLWFAGGLLVSMAALTGIAWALLQFLRLLPRLLPRTLPASLRHGIANLYRPGAHAEAVLVALGIGVTFTLTVYLVQHSVLTQMVKSAPPDMPNVFFLNVTDQERPGLVDLIRRQPGVSKDIELTPSVAARLLSVNGVAVEELDLSEGMDRRFRSTNTITWFEKKPDDMDVLQGSWWGPGESGSQQSLVSVRDDASQQLGVSPGSKLEFQVGSRTIAAQVTAVHRAEGFRSGGNFEFIFNPGALEGLPAVFYGGVRIDPRQVPELQREAYEQFPTVSVINASDVLQIVQDVVDQIALVVRFVSAFAILAGGVILVSSVVATRFRRIREVAILKTLGATRRQVARIFSVEFVILGFVAGLMGSVLASAFSGLLLTEVLQAEFVFDPLPNVVSILATALLANGAGWLASSRILNRKPLDVLRSE